MALLTGLHLVARPALAASEESLERAARKACLAGDAAKGVAILAALYVRTDDPVFIFNQGRCFEQNGKYEEAIVRFREFQQKNQDAGRGTDAEAEKHIEKCQSLLDAKTQREKAGPVAAPVAVASSTTVISPAATAAAPTTEPLAASPPTPVVPELAPAANAKASADTARARATSGAGLRISGIAAAAVGVAGIATGIILNLKANNLSDEIQTQLPYQRSKEDTRASYETWSWVGYGVGGACLVGGAVLYYLGLSQGRQSQVALVPSVGAGSLGATLQGAF